MRLPGFLRRLRLFERRWIPPRDERDEHEATVRDRLRTQTTSPRRKPSVDPDADGEPPPDS